MENLELYNKVREVPKDAQRAITAGRLKGFTDINPMWRVKCLTEQFGPCGLGWYYKTVEKWMDTVGDEICVFVAIELYVKYKDEWSQAIPGTGGSKLATKERNGVYVSDECYKMATTDALSVACKNLGIGEMSTGKKAIPSTTRQTTVLPKFQVLIYLDSDHT